MPAYTTKVSAAGATRAQAYDNLASIFQHLNSLGVDITALAMAGGIVTLTTTQVIPAIQRPHIGLN